MSQYLIGTVTVGAGGQATIQFNSIAQNFTDLMLTMSLRGSSNPTSTSIADGYVTLNGAESSKTGRLLYGQGSGAGASGSYTNLNIWYPSSGATANTFGNAVINIPNYSSGANKALSIDMVSESNETFTYGMMFAGLWANTAAVTSITLTASGTTWAAGSTASLYGIKNLPASLAKATGGAITFDANYVYHAFTGSGTFTPTTSLTADVLVVAGGGAGGESYGAGGGAGGLRYLSSQSISTAQTVTIGAGGVNNSTSGSSTSFGATTSTGGGLGGANGHPTGASGGSGGGGGYTPSGTIIGAGGAGTSGQGNNGGTAAGTGNSFMGLGGGGGAGGVGSAASGGVGGAGGAGVSTYSSWATATSTGVNVSGTYYYAGGGSGNGTGGASVPNAGGTAWNAAGPANTGNGGGGDSGLNGGSGIVIIRYAR